MKNNSKTTSWRTEKKRRKSLIWTHLRTRTHFNRFQLKLKIRTVEKQSSMCIKALEKRHKNTLTTTKSNKIFWRAVFSSSLPFGSFVFVNFYVVFRFFSWIVFPYVKCFKIRIFFASLYSFRSFHSHSNQLNLYVLVWTRLIVYIFFFTLFIIFIFFLSFALSILCIMCVVCTYSLVLRSSPMYNVTFNFLWIDGKKNVQQKNTRAWNII